MTMSSSISMSNAGPPTTATGMETVVAVALGALAAVFLGALLVLLVICRRQRCYYNQKDSAELSSDLLEGENITGLGLDVWESEEWLAGAERWVDDATGLAPPCIAVLRSCHALAASLTTIAGTDPYFCPGCSTYTTSRRRRRSQSVPTVGRQTIGGQGGSSGVGCDSLGIGNQARCAQEPSQETGVYRSSLERHGHTFAGAEKRGVGPGSGLLYPSLYASLSIHRLISQ